MADKPTAAAVRVANSIGFPTRMPQTRRDEIAALVESEFRELVEAAR
jgi:hypothetical protein